MSTNKISIPETIVRKALTIGSVVFVTNGGTFSLGTCGDSFMNKLRNNTSFTIRDLGKRNIPEIVAFANKIMGKTIFSVVNNNEIKADISKLKPISKIFAFRLIRGLVWPTNINWNTVNYIYDKHNWNALVYLMLVHRVFEDFLPYHNKFEKEMSTAKLLEAAEKTLLKDSITRWWVHTFSTELMNMDYSYYTRNNTKVKLKEWFDSLSKKINRGFKVNQEYKFKKGFKLPNYNESVRIMEVKPGLVLVRDKYYNHRWISIKRLENA